MESSIIKLLLGDWIEISSSLGKNGNAKIDIFAYDNGADEGVWLGCTPDQAVEIANRLIETSAGQQVADLKAENAELRKDIEGLRKIVKAATEYVNGHFYAEPQWRLNRLFENMCTAMDTPQPKEDKQS